MIDTDNQGWQSPKHQYKSQQDKILLTRYKIDQPKTILKETNHSLQPDMIMGWKPKLPSCPLPLSYFNAYNQQLIEHIPKDDRFRIVYLGKRYANSVQVNQQYPYFWKYRQRYSLNIALVQEAVKNVGKNEIKLSESIKNQLSQKDLMFDSSFESGNLQIAVRVKPTEYDLFLRSDTNTKGHTNWYYFKVNNRDLVGNVQFNICNIGKTKTLYNKGMKPYVKEQNGQDCLKSNDVEKWSQEKTYDVCFVERYCRYGFDRKTYQLQFKYDFKKPNTNVYFAYGIPYTYSQLQKFISEITENNKQTLKCQKLCQSLGGLNLPLLIISNKNNKQETNQNKSLSTSISKHLSLDKNESLPDKKQKRAVLITGRIHPGQSNASYVLQGFIRQLLKNNQTSLKLRDMYTFYIIPMLNPDGVVAGNYRTSYSGKDLNRQFNKLNKFIYPQIFALDQFATQLKQKYKKRLQFYLDFHGHSSKKNLFCYGPEYQPSNQLFFKSRTFAKIIQEINPIFSYHKSVFQISEQKKSTGRAHMLWKIKIPMTYTFQISNGLYDTKERKNVHLNESSMIESGRAIYKGLSRYIELETKSFGALITKAKVDSGIHSRKLVSQKGSRQKGFKIHRVVSNKASIDLSRETSLQKNTIQITSQSLQIKDFDRYFMQIKKEQTTNSQPEGGSDSEGTDEDLSDQELNKLHQYVQNRTSSGNQFNGRHYFNFKSKKLDKIKERKTTIQQFDQSNKQNTQTENVIVKIKQEKVNGMETSRRLYQLSQKIKPVKKPPLPLINVNTKYVLCQKKFTVDF